MSDGLGESHVPSVEVEWLKRQIAAVQQEAGRVASWGAGRMTRIYSDRQGLFGMALWGRMGRDPLAGKRADF